MTKITDTILRDAHQSQAATRMTTEEMLPIAPLMDSIGFGQSNAGVARRLTPACVF